MAASWSFNTADPSDVEIEITQRDQFNNDDVGLNDALVREVIQNSLDAKAGDEPVKVCFSIQNLSEIGDHAVEMLRDNIAPLKPHFEACYIHVPKESSIRVLTIEDFNTNGLTGSVDQKNPDENFTNFWRVVGKSKKEGQQGGRWGLGKLVFSSSSQIRTFFGVTRRDGDAKPYTMGQVLLEHHKVEGTPYRPHGFWHDGRSEPDNIQMPTTDEGDLAFLETISNTRRRKRNGLSIIIPFIHNSIDELEIVRSVMRNYYFPIISGHLVVDVGYKGKVLSINSSSFESIFAKTNMDSKHIPVSFLYDVSRSIEDTHEVIESKVMDSSEFSKASLEVDQIEQLKTQFNEGSMLHVIVPVILTRMNGEFKYGRFHVFLQSVKSEPQFSFFARGPILLTAEKSKISGQVRAGIIAEYNDPVSEFLGDAETPSHTKLNYRATRLLERWERPSPIINAIRNSLKALFDIVAEQEDTEDSDALSYFFSIKELQKRRKGKKRKKSTTEGEGEEGSPDPPPPPTPVGFVIAKNPDGFTLVSTTDAETWEFPREVRITMAYDMVGGNPLNYYSPYDFDLYDPASTTVESNGGEINENHPVQKQNAKEKESKYESNEMVFTVHEHNFRLSVKLLDLNRDLFVQAELVT